MERPTICNESDSHWQFLQPKELKFSATASKPVDRSPRPPLAGAGAANYDLRKLPRGNRRLKAIPVRDVPGLKLPPPPPSRRFDEPTEGDARRSNAKESVALSKMGNASSSPFGVALQPQAFLIEGNSVLNTENNHAFQVLDHLGHCVAVERRLREELERVRKQKLDAFREVVRVYLRFIREPHPLGHPHSDGVQLARCSVIANTLATTIQSYMRRRYSMQLSTLLRRIQSREGGGERRSANRTMNLSPCPNSEDGSRSVEDVLDTKEINELKQLYFNYFDCETVSVGSEGEDCLGTVRQARKPLHPAENEVSTSSFSAYASTTM